MKKYKLFILIFLFLGPILISEVKAADPDVSNSDISIAVGEINPETEIEISVWAADGFNAPISGASINLSSTAGLFTSNSLLEVSGVSDANGWFNSTWKSPYLSFITLEEVVYFSANISDDSWVEVANSITVKHLDITNIENSVLLAPSSVLSGETIEISTLVKDSVDNPFPDMQVTYTVTDGIIQTSIQDLTDVSGFFNLTWQAPVINSATDDYNVTITSTVEASDSQNVTLEQEIQMLPPPFRNFTISWDHAGTLLQNQTMDVTLTIRDKDNNSIILGADVTLLLDIGEWIETNDFTVTQQTNALGQVTVTYNANKTALLLEENTVNITAMISMINFNDLSNSSSFTLIKMDTFDFNYTLSSTSIMQGESVIFNFLAFRNHQPWTNATFSVIASAGHFEAGNISIRLRTDSNGQLMVTWNSSSIPTLNEDLDVYFTIELVNSGLTAEILQITVTVDTDASSTTTESNPDDLIPVIAIGGLVGVVVIGGAAVLLRRRS